MGNAGWLGWTGKKAYKRLMVRKLMVARGRKGEMGRVDKVKRE